MTTSPVSSGPAEDQPPEVTDHLAWRRHITALASAAAGINHASNSWDAVSDSFCDQDGWPVDEKGYADGKVKRDAEAWKHVEVFLDHGPEVLAGVRAATDSSDYAVGPINEDLRRSREIETTLGRAGRLRHEWDQIMVLMEGSQPGSLQLYQESAEEHRNAEGWHYAHELSDQGPALIRAAEYLADRTDAERPSHAERTRVALSRSAPGNRRVPSDAPAAAPGSNPPAPSRSR
ncbi:MULTISPECIES: hypothetical protein [unclassified Streptomyces]|uniref:hypothetical protein n=1 Tax=unclassified Streptomyces TaxID=2593676 RepID=UPI0001C1CB78|nr:MULTISPECIES: hypothetical protein [unclassified Streptomyces]AEN10777.1 conserved hypothetical protein [Streptomyces sp. SirexAA-E]MYR65453.1 hypothetical protein [Streptomyces sp. SID4939]MYS01393.1 hypothetical protein [Streptomyces sp. SID4940]MYT62523.1 hypothetical protein [Streptomyces sp. SID8357]MYT89330.1 hypothetical protein [Streptomyces sp. SID8360]